MVENIGWATNRLMALLDLECGFASFPGQRISVCKFLLYFHLILCMMLKKTEKQARNVIFTFAQFCCNYILYHFKHQHVYSPDRSFKTHLSSMQYDITLLSFKFNEVIYAKMVYIDTFIFRAQHFAHLWSGFASVYLASSQKKFLQVYKLFFIIIFF